MHRSPLRSVLHLAALGILVALPAMAAPLVTPEAASQALLFRPETAGLALQLTVTGPEGFVFERSFTGDQTPALPTSGLADGMYRWELRADLSSSDADASGERRRRSRAELAGGRTPAVATGETRQQGTFRIVDGAPVELTQLRRVRDSLSEDGVAILRLPLASLSPSELATLTSTSAVGLGLVVVDEDGLTRVYQRPARRAARARPG